MTGTGGPAAVRPAAVRPAMPADLPALARLETAAMGVDAWGPAALAAEVAGVPAIRTVLVADRPGGRVPGPSDPVAYGVLFAVVVEPGWRRRGHGGAVLRALVADAERRGCLEVLLEVAADNLAARALYAAYGFGEIARRAAYYAGGRDALVLWRPLAVPRS